MTEIERVVGDLRRAGLQTEVPASPVEIRRLIDYFGGGVPEEYIEFLRVSNGLEGASLEVAPWHVLLWAAESIIERWEGYRMQELIPHFFAFGSDGGDEMLVFERTKSGSSAVFRMPYIGMADTAKLAVSGDFGGFLRMLRRP